jgi:hypothetical protein
MGHSWRILAPFVVSTKPGEDLSTAPPSRGDAPAEVALHRPIDVQPYPIRLVNWFMSK